MATATTGRSDQVNCCREEPTGSGHAQVQSSSGTGGARPVSVAVGFGGNQQGKGHDQQRDAVDRIDGTAAPERERRSRLDGPAAARKGHRTRRSGSDNDGESRVLRRPGPRPRRSPSTSWTTTRSSGSG